MSTGAKRTQWQRDHRARFRQERGYSTTSDYRAGGLRQAVLDRDGFACITCGMTDAEHKAKWGRPITIDHKDKDRSNNTMENLRTMCLTCHGRKDITPSLTVQQVICHKEEIIRRRTAGETYQQIAADLGFSPASVWKWYRRWTEGTGVKRVFKNRIIEG
jgi:hypothetical protein